MQNHSHNTFTTILAKGLLLPADLLQGILAGDKDLADWRQPNNSPTDTYILARST